MRRERRGCDVAAANDEGHALAVQALAEGTAQCGGRGGARGLDAVDEAPWREHLHHRRDSRAQPPAPDRDDHRLQVRNLLGKLEPEGGGAERHMEPLEWMDERASLFPLDLRRAVEGAVNVLRKLDRGAQIAAGLDPEGIGGLRHHDLGRGFEHPGGVRHGHGVIPGADRGHAPREGGRRQGLHDRERAPRGLKLPVRWNSSSLRKAWVRLPTIRLRASSSHSRTGVRAIKSPRRARVSRISSRVGASRSAATGTSVPRACGGSDSQDVKTAGSRRRGERAVVSRHHDLHLACLPDE